MRILLVTPFFPPQSTIASLRTHPFAMSWRQAGEDVTVLTTAKRYDQQGLDLPKDGLEVVEIDYRIPKVFERLRSTHKEAEEEGAPARAPECPIPEAEQGNPVARNGRARSAMAMLSRLKDRTGIFSAVRMPDLTDYWIAPAMDWCFACGAKGRGWDVVVSSSGPYTAHLLARRIKRAGLARLWAADFRDLWTDNHLYRGLFPFTLRERQLEKQCLEDADLLVTVSDGFASTLERKSGKPVQVIYNGFDPQAIRDIPAERALPRDGCVRLVYTGTLYPQGQDPGLLLRALGWLRDQRPALATNLRLTVAGQGCGVWKELGEKLGVQTMLETYGTVSRSDALRLQRDADGLVLLDWKDSRKGWLAAKVFEYLAAKAPIIALGGGDGSALGKLLAKSSRGVHLGSDKVKIETALIDLIERPSRVGGGHRNEEFIATLTRKHQSMRMLELLRTAIRGAPIPGSGLVKLEAG